MVRSYVSAVVRFSCTSHSSTCWPAASIFTPSISVSAVPNMKWSSHRGVFWLAVATFRVTEPLAFMEAEAV